VTFCHGLKLEAPDGCIKDMRRRDTELGKGWGQIVTPLVVETEDGIELSTICRQLKMKAPDGYKKNRPALSCPHFVYN